jgi:hypothetical protein
MAAKYIIFEKEKYRDSYERHDFETLAEASEAIISGDFKEGFIIVERKGLGILDAVDADAFETREEREEREADSARALARATELEPVLKHAEPVEIVEDLPQVSATPEAAAHEQASVEPAEAIVIPAITEEYPF